MAESQDGIPSFHAARRVMMDISEIEATGDQGDAGASAE
jgi:hypothetical protein